jgi:hypothetical protein
LRQDIGAPSAFAAIAAPHPQPLFTYPPQRFVLFAPKQNMQPAMTEPLAHGRKLALPCPCQRIVCPSAAIAHRRAIT